MSHAIPNYSDPACPSCLGIEDNRHFNFCCATDEEAKAVLPMVCQECGHRASAGQVHCEGCGTADNPVPLKWDPTVPKPAHRRIRRAH